MKRKKKDKVSIIIPTYNEEPSIGKLLAHLQKCTEDRNPEIIVADGGSSDRTEEIVKRHGVRFIVSKKKGRAAQMNLGVEHSKGNLLYFVHADSFPPCTFIDDLYQSLELGYDCGCYRFRFDSNHPLLKVNSYLTRFDRLMYRGGDQTLFISRKLFEELGGYKEHFVIMEDFELIRTLRKHHNFRIIQKDVIVSARKYENNPYLKVNFVNLVIFIMYFFGVSQETMVHAYKELIHKTRFG